MRSGIPYNILRFEKYENPLDPEHDGKIYLHWSWIRESDGALDTYWLQNLDHWEVWPSYSYLDANNKIMWADLASETVDQNVPMTYQWDFFWDIPQIAENVHFRLHPVCKSESECIGGYYFEEDYLNTGDKYFGGSTKPDTPSAPSVTQDSDLGTTVVLGLDNVSLEGNNIYVTKAEFQVIRYLTTSPTEVGTISRSVTALIDEFGNVRTTLAIGSDYGYKFRARLCSVKVKHGDGADDPIVVYSNWSEMTEMLPGVCKKPVLKVNKFNSTQVEYHIETDSRVYAYQLEMAPDRECFVKMDEWEFENPQYKRDSEQREAAYKRFGIVLEWMHTPDSQATEATKNWTENVLAEAQDLAYYRARSLSAEQDGFFSQWSDITDENTLSFGEGLRAPIIWSATEFAEVDDPSIQLNVMHNSPNGSPSCLCRIMYFIDRPVGEPHIIDIEPPSGQTSGNVVYTYNFDLSGFTEETLIYWAAITFEGSEPIAANASPQSEQKVFAIHQKPGVTVTIPLEMDTDPDSGLPIVNAFPIPYLTETTYFSSSDNKIKISSMSFKVISKQSYRRLDRYGNPIVIKAGDVLYSTLDVQDPRDKTRYINANEITLDDGIEYILEATVCLNTGASETDTFNFTFEKALQPYIIDCTGHANPNNLSLDLQPSAVIFEEGGSGGNPWPDLETIDNMPAHIPEGNTPFTDNNGAVHLNDTGDRFVLSSNRDDSEAGGYDIYAFASDYYDSETETGWSEGIAKQFAEANNMTLSEFTQFCKDNCLWIASTKVKASLNRDDGYFNILGDYYYPSVVIIGTDYDCTGSASGISCVPLFTGASEARTEPEVYIPGHEYESTYETAEAFGIAVMNKTALGMNLMRIHNSYYLKDFPVVVDPYVVIEIINPDYIDARDDAISVSVEYSLIQSIIVTQELADMSPELEPYIGQFYVNAQIDLGATGIEYSGMPYVNPSMTTTMPFPKVGGSSGGGRTFAENVKLSVYRINDDGSMVPIAENIDNVSGTNVTDPHPNLGGSNYRIVATDMVSGQMTYYDPPPYDMKCTDIVLQWDEFYAHRPNTNNYEDELPEMGNMVRLPYNIDVSESANMETEMVNYIGRANPVSYYGTQTGYTASWSTEIPKYDKETIKMLRKLQVYPGDVYVREPNGTGYWAHATVTFPINHLALTVSVSISLTRVEGGI